MLRNREKQTQSGGREIDRQIKTETEVQIKTDRRVGGRKREKKLGHSVGGGEGGVGRPCSAPVPRGTPQW